MSIKPYITGGSITFSQESDSCDERKLDQNLEISSDDAGAGLFMVIKTERWAIDSIEELTQLLKHARKFFLDEKYKNPLDKA